MQDSNRNIPFDDLSNSAKEVINTTLDREKITREIELDLRTNDKYKIFFEQFNTSSINSFIDHYKIRKAAWVMWGDLYKSIEEKKILKYSSLASEKLWEIQQKKLFDIQCQWRAEMINIPGIKTTHDFMYWEVLIKNCPFIPPITETELELYIEYTLSDDFDIERSYHGDWQLYDEYREEYINTNNGTPLPEWYQFYDSRMGTGALLSLPDLRGTKEAFYSKLYFDDYHKNNPVKTIYNSNYDNRPALKYYAKDVIDKFVEDFESTKIKNSYRAMRNQDLDSFEHDEELSNAVEILKQDDSIEISYAGNWRNSILKTARNYEKQKIAETLPIAYKNYLNRLNMGILFDADDTEQRVESVNEIIKIYTSHILIGRRLNNEPEDLNF